MADLGVIVLMLMTDADMGEVAGGLVPLVHDVQVVVRVHGRLVLVFLTCDQLVLHDRYGYFARLSSLRTSGRYVTQRRAHSPVATGVLNAWQERAKFDEPLRSPEGGGTVTIANCSQ